MPKSLFFLLYFHPSSTRTHCLMKKREFGAKKDCKCGRYPLIMTNSDCWIIYKLQINFEMHFWTKRLCGHTVNLLIAIMNRRNDYSNENLFSVLIWAPDCCFKTDLTNCEPFLQGERLVICYVFPVVNKSHVQSQTNNSSYLQVLCVYP